MANKKPTKNRDGTGFVALPHVVQDSSAYKSLSFSARALLLDIARQYTGSNNGKLVTCAKALADRGWNSNATVTKAQRELMEYGFLCLTRQGFKPNKASWYALTWLSLDWSPEMDIQQSAFRRGMYLQNNF
jgi:hypothetical protein